MIPGSGALILSLLSLLWLLAWPSPLAAVIKPAVSPYLRLEGQACRLSYAPKSQYLAFTDGDDRSLSFVSLTTRRVVLVTPHLVGPSFFWSPDGHRLFFRELVKSPMGALSTIVKVYDVALAKSVELSRLSGSSGFLTFDPRDLRFQLMTPTGILSRRIFFPDERLAHWQTAARTERGKWLATQRGLLWLSHGGLAMQRLKDDNSGLASFALSPDGQSAAWSTVAGHVYIADSTTAPRLVGWGRDPTWHPQRSLIVYAASHRVGTKVIDTDLRIVDLKGSGRYLTRTAQSSERWPVWIDKGKALLYTIDGSTDVRKVEFKE